ncbi:unnamed protein product [Lampetra planeri]
MITTSGGGGFMTWNFGLKIKNHGHRRRVALPQRRGSRSRSDEAREQRGHSRERTMERSAPRSTERRALVGERVGKRGDTGARERTAGSRHRRRRDGD